MGAGAVIAMDVVFGLLDRAMAYAAVVNKAKSENRDVSSEELDALAAADDVAKAKLDAAIAKARAEGR